MGDMAGNGVIVRGEGLDDMKGFVESGFQLGLVEREVGEEKRKGFEALFEALLEATPFEEVAGKVKKDALKEEMVALLSREVPEELMEHPMFEAWVDDMVSVCRMFCDVLGEDAISFWVGSERGCHKYHTDNVPFRALVTYHGVGTEWVPETSLKRQAFVDRFANGFENAAPPESYLMDTSTHNFLLPWTLAIFRGGEQGVVHRTPQIALDTPTILMRLDLPGWWDMLEQQSYDMAEGVFYYEYEYESGDEEEGGEEGVRMDEGAGCGCDCGGEK